MYISHHPGHHTTLGTSHHTSQHHTTYSLHRTLQQDTLCLHFATCATTRTFSNKKVWLRQPTRQTSGGGPLPPLPPQSPLLPPPLLPTPSRFCAQEKNSCVYFPNLRGRSKFRDMESGMPIFVTWRSSCFLWCGRYQKLLGGDWQQ